jgi:LPXTG-site transpeptidase (sortase) family protein
MHKYWTSILAVFVLVILLFVYNKTPNAIEASGVLTFSTTTPMHMKIPNIGVDATIESLGLTPDGAVDVPKGPKDVAWFNRGPRPGEIGSAVISGHFGWKNGIPAVFDNLNKLKSGDKIYVENENGTKATFIVREIRTYDSRANAPEVFNSQSGTHLNLITCGGNWIANQKSYTKRLVVFADILN